MTGVTIVPAPADLAERRRAPLLVEDRVGHYDEFRAFLARSFDLDRVGLSEPGYVKAPSGDVYAWVFVGRSGEPFPAAVELYALPPALEPLDDERIERDVWAMLRWLMDGAGPPWSAELLDRTGQLYRVPAAGG